MNEPSDASAEPQAGVQSSCRASCSGHTESLQLLSAPPLVSNVPEQFLPTVAGYSLSAHVRSTATATSLSRIETEWSSENRPHVFPHHSGFMH